MGNNLVKEMEKTQDEVQKTNVIKTENRARNLKANRKTRNCYMICRSKPITFPK